MPTSASSFERTFTGRCAVIMRGRDWSFKKELDACRRYRLQFQRLFRKGCMSAADCQNALARFGDMPDCEVIQGLLEYVSSVSCDNHKCDESVIDLDGFLHLMSIKERPKELCVDMYEAIGALKMLFDEEYLMYSAKRDQAILRANEIALGRRRPTGLIESFVEFVPPIFIVLNVVVVGISTDSCPLCRSFTVIELCFLVFFTCEVVVKLVWYRCSGFFCGEHRLWNWFDTICVTVGYIEISLTMISGYKHGAELTPNAQRLVILRVFRLARLARLVRLLEFKMFEPLRNMVNGVLTGIGILCWALLLLFITVFILGVWSRQTIGISTGYVEFENLPASMFTLFRCFTDDCTDQKGQPIQELLRHHFQGHSMGLSLVWMFVYCVVTVTVILGLFNLVMAIFIDNVVSRNITRRQKLNVYNEEYIKNSMCESMLGIIGNMLVDPITRAHFDDMRGCLVAEISMTEGDRGDFSLRQAVIERWFEEAGMSWQESVITREHFNSWIEEPDVITLLEQADIETANKYQLFDVLDRSGGGELTIDEFLTGLMKVRGPISKVDIVATRLMMEYVTDMVENIVCHLGIDVDNPNALAYGSF